MRRQRAGRARPASHRSGSIDETADGLSTLHQAGSHQTIVTLSSELQTMHFFMNLSEQAPLA
jgi:hypothetical protein